MIRVTLAAFAVILCGCASQSPTENVQAVPEAAAAPDRLIFAFQRQKDPAQLKDDADAVGSLLSEGLGIPVEVLVPASYGATVQALVSGRAHVGYLSSLPFLLAERETGVEVLLAEERASGTQYDSVLVVAADSPIRTIADLRGKHIAFTSPTSASGYVFPIGFFIEKGLLPKGAQPEEFFGKTQFAGGYDQALRAVLRGQADVAAVSDYTMEGPTADKYLTVEERSKLRVLERVPGVPTHLIAVRSDLPASLKDGIRKALLDLAKNQPDRLADVYGATTFVEPKGDHVASARLALERTGLDRAAVVE
jgi:phosphonate transport system substrate-binding protein